MQKTPVRPRSAKPQRPSIYAVEKPKRAEPKPNVLASLRATQIVASKPALPAELIALILDYLPPSDLLRCARASKRLYEMVYDDTRWIQKLKAMGVWNDLEARQETKHTLDSPTRTRRRISGMNGHAGGLPAGGDRSSMLFDVSVEEEKSKRSFERSIPRPKSISVSDGFEDLEVSKAQGSNPKRALVVMRQVKSIRGRARQEYGKIHGSLYPFYADLTDSAAPTESMLFKTYQEPSQQAQMFANLLSFGRVDTGPGWAERARVLKASVTSFESAIMNGFDQAYSTQDIDKMRRFAHASYLLDHGQAVSEAFISAHPLILRPHPLANPSDCVDGVAPGHVDLGPSHRFFERLALVFSEQSELIDKVFPPTLDVLTAFLNRVIDMYITEFVEAALNETQRQGRETYLKAVPGVFEHAMRFTVSIRPTMGSKPDFKEELKTSIIGCFQSHISTYLTEEVEFFRTKSRDEVSDWEKQLSEQEAQTESFFMSNISRQAAKRDFLSTFKKVVMMPVNVLPAFPSSAKPTPAIDKSSRPLTPSLSGGAFPSRPLTPAVEPPTTELAAKAAIMNSRLEGIKTLFSIEVALSLVHHAKAAIERVATIVRHSNASFAAEAKKQCEAIFISLLQILGQQHIKPGFDKAVQHLTTYKPRQVKELRAQDSGNVTETLPAQGVEPLVTFLELVNVGDLIQQMVDVFYVQELVSTNMTDTDDFLNPAGKEKKHFEQMLDERVAAGMGKGIDVLMEEVEYILATTQQVSDFNPGAEKGGNASASTGLMDIGPSKTALVVVETIQNHTSMLIGSTEKQMLDVFFQEVGLRLFHQLCKHIKRLRISVDGSIKLIR